MFSFKDFITEGFTIYIHIMRMKSASTLSMYTKWCKMLMLRSVASTGQGLKTIMI